MSDTWPVALVQDRHSKLWIRVAECDRRLTESEASTLGVDAGMTRIEFVVSEDGPHGEADFARAFWRDPPSWIERVSTEVDSDKG